MLSKLIAQLLGGKAAGPRAANLAAAAGVAQAPPAVPPARPASPGYGGRQLLQCRYGAMLVEGPFIGKCLELYGEYSEAEVALMRQFIRPGDTVIDVGANIGDLTLPLARMVGEAGRVYAVESHAEVYNVLCANLALNNLRNVKPLNVFIAASAASADTASAWGEFAFVSEVWTPPFVPLDSLGITQCRLLKIDVDGKELDVLQSGAQLLARCRPVLYFENDMQEVSAPLLAHVLGLDYDLYWHAPPIFSPDNFRGDPVNHWAPDTVTSAMMLGIPRELGLQAVNLPRVTGADQWWDLADPRVVAQTAPGFAVQLQARDL